MFFSTTISFATTIASHILQYKRNMTYKSLSLYKLEKFSKRTLNQLQEILFVRKNSQYRKHTLFEYQFYCAQ